MEEAKMKQIKIRNQTVMELDTNTNEEENKCKQIHDGENNITTQDK